ncbi:transcriptional regulator family: Fungal Specific TF [Penicillium argentinense]|uniref:Transcriptional regulator family: Fungal Specific TF n=1 Tax=Penicillium argentinense TaxID=1131581 RepID=A0A9W9G1F7_9EURO|nr:transcriptional regulator family: Fungal Specific TF [Penicillium argentinense]KAJ5110241.1 transcriptional regulator family: Fungal Specific TF [Penicillium argentinense]
MWSVFLSSLSFPPEPVYQGSCASAHCAHILRAQHSISWTVRLIPVAVHCRRRKIRCLVAADDTQGRCENCIRLRKECQFFPVDQQPPVEKKSRPSSRLETQSTDRSVTTPISSSPTNLKMDAVDAYYPYSPMPLSASSGQDMSTFPGAFPATPMSGFTPDRPMATGEFTGHPTMETGVPWDEFTTISDPQMLATMTANKSQMMNLAPGVWNPNAMPAALPNSPMSAQAQPMNTGQAYTMQPDGSVWPVPPQPSRTVSYPGQADISSSYPNQFPPQMPPDLKRRMTTPAQPMSGAQTSPGPTPDMQAGPGSVSYPPPAGMGYAQWPVNNAMAGMNVVPYPMYGGDPVQQQPYPNPPMGHPPGRTGP